MQPLELNQSRSPAAPINLPQLYLRYLGRPLLILKPSEPLRLIPVLVFVALASFRLIIFRETSSVAFPAKSYTLK